MKSWGGTFGYFLCLRLLKKDARVGCARRFRPHGVMTKLFVIIAMPSETLPLHLDV